MGRFEIKTADFDLDDRVASPDGSIRQLLDRERRYIRKDGAIMWARSVSGPDVRLSPHTAQSVAMALYELAINAVKYGAVSDPCGHVDVVWL